MKQKAFAALLSFTLLLTSCGITPPGGAQAATMHLRKTEGRVGVFDDAGKDMEPREDLGLYSGYGVDTRSESYAWIDLDEVKLTKLDEKSEIAITKEDKKLEIEVLSGSLFFNVTQPLEDGEAMTIRASTMAVGIRGTCGWVSLEDDEHLTLYLLEGEVECSAGDETATVTAGEAARMSGAGEIAVAPFSEEDIPAFVMDELDEELLEEARSFLAPDPRAALETIAYYGDPAGCTMTPEQAAAFLQVIRGNMAELEAAVNNYRENYNGEIFMNGMSMGTLEEHPGMATAALFDLGDGTPALIYAHGMVNRVEGSTYHWLTGKDGIWLYQNGAAVQYTSDYYNQAIFDGYLLSSEVFGPPYAVYPIENGSIAAQPSATAEARWSYRNNTNTYTYYIDGAEVSRDAFDAWIGRWVHAEPYPDNWGSPAWENPQSPAGIAHSTDIPWSSWGMSPIEDVIAALELFTGEAAPAGPAGNGTRPDGSLPPLTEVVNASDAEIRDAIMANINRMYNASTKVDFETLRGRRAEEFRYYITENTAVVSFAPGECTLDPNVQIEDIPLPFSLR